MKLGRLREIEKLGDEDAYWQDAGVCCVCQVLSEWEIDIFIYIPNIRDKNMSELLKLFTF